MRPSYFLFIRLVRPECSRRYLYLLVDQYLCLSSVSSVVESNTVLASAASAVGTSMVIDYLNSEVNQPPFSQHHRSSPRSDLQWNGDQHAYICRYRKTDTPATTQTMQSRRVPRKSVCIRLRGRFHPLRWKWRSCVCESPHTICQGKCGNNPNCASGTPPQKRRVDELKNAHCDNGYTACGAL